MWGVTVAVGDTPFGVLHHVFILVPVFQFPHGEYPLKPSMVLFEPGAFRAHAIVRGELYVGGNGLCFYDRY